MSTLSSVPSLGSLNGLMDDGFPDDELDLGSGGGPYPWMSSEYLENQLNSSSSLHRGHSLSSTGDAGAGESSSKAPVGESSGLHCSSSSLSEPELCMNTHKYETHSSPLAPYEHAPLTTTHSNENRSCEGNLAMQNNPPDQPRQGVVRITQQPPPVVCKERRDVADCLIVVELSSPVQLVQLCVDVLNRENNALTQTLHLVRGDNGDFAFDLVGPAGPIRADASRAIPHKKRPTEVLLVLAAARSSKVGKYRFKISIPAASGAADPYPALSDEVVVRSKPNTKYGGKERSSELMDTIASRHRQIRDDFSDGALEPARVDKDLCLRLFSSAGNTAHANAPRAANMKRGAPPYQPAVMKRLKLENSSVVDRAALADLVHVAENVGIRADKVNEFNSTLKSAVQKLMCIASDK